MSLEALRESLASGGPPAVHRTAPVPTEAPEATPEPEEPRGVVQVVTPSGLEIYYQAAPKRLYRVRQTFGEDDTPYAAGETDWVEVPSVSTVLEVLEKGGLSWWGMKVGVEGLLTLLKNDEDGDLDFYHFLGVEGVIERLKEHKLTVNHVKSQAADRGTNVHSALEAYAETGVIPDPQFYPESERGYVEGLVAFLRDSNLAVEHSELMVASTDGWAGRFDIVGEVEGEVVVKTYPKRLPKTEKVSGRWLLDLKTSKGVYPSYKLQTAAYRQGFQECGYGTVDRAGVVRVTADGKYELVASTATYEDFLSVLETYKTIARLS